MLLKSSGFYPTLLQISVAHCAVELMAPKDAFDHGTIFSQVTTTPRGIDYFLMGLPDAVTLSNACQRPK